MRTTTRSVAAPAPSGAPVVRRRRRWPVVVAVVVALLLVYWWQLGPQTVSMLTHRKGAPTETWALTPLAADPDLRIAAVGDVGEGEEIDWSTSWAISRSGDDVRYDVLLVLGDNVYPSGDPARLEYTIFRPFDRVLDDGADLYAIVGNHDASHADEQMDVLGMPGTWWAAHLPGDVLLVGLDSNRVADPNQRTFLEDTLRDATERWRIVAVHEPPYSAGYQGSNLTVREAFSPLFARYGVQLVLSGHEHDYQRSVPVDGVSYVVSGAAGRTRGTGEDTFTAVSYAVYHFVDVNVFADRMLVRAVDQDARVFDEFEIAP